jgi:hypothetical protein
MNGGEGGKVMPYQRDEEGVRGFRIEDEIVCPNCIEEEEIEEMTKGNLLTEDDLEDEIFCDRCNRKL